MKKLILRVDDRLIHGQVIEGWIKNFKIKDVYIVSDNIYKDQLQQMIYSSILPAGCNFKVYSIEKFHKIIKKLNPKKPTIVLFESIDDFYEFRHEFNDSMYLNIGCVASREHKIEISDTVFLDVEEIKKLCEIRQKFELNIRKLPWETGVEIKNFAKYLEESN